MFQLRSRNTSRYKCCTKRHDSSARKIGYRFTVRDAYTVFFVPPIPEVIRSKLNSRSWIRRQDIPAFTTAARTASSTRHCPNDFGEFHIPGPGIRVDFGAETVPTPAANRVIPPHVNRKPPRPKTLFCSPSESRTMYRETANDGGNALTAVLIAPAGNTSRAEIIPGDAARNRPAGAPIRGEGNQQLGRSLENDQRTGNTG